MFFSNKTEKRAVKFVDSNGPALAQHIAYNVANPINELKDTLDLDRVGPAQPT